MTHLSKIVISLFLLLTFSATGQINMQFCENLSNNHQLISDDILTGIDQFNCETNVNKQLFLNDQSENYNKLEKASLLWTKDLSQLKNLTGSPMSKNESVSHFFDVGKTWAILTGEIDGEKVIACKSFEFLETVAPIVTTDLCTLDPLNVKVVDFYERDYINIDWGDGKTEEFRLNEGSVAANHEYEGFFKEVKVTSYFKREDEIVCESKPFVVERDIPAPVFMTDLEGLNDETEVRIRFLGEPDVKYSFEGIRDGEKDWINMSEAEDGEGQIIGLDPQQKYCFRVRTENECKEPFYSVNTLCNIVINREVVSNSSMRIVWNLPDKPEQSPNSMKLERKDDLRSVTSVKNSFSNPLTTKFLDEDLICNEDYFYKIMTDYPPVKFEDKDVTVRISTSFISQQISDTKVDAKPDYFALASFHPDDNDIITFNVVPGDDNYQKINQIYYYGANTGDKDFREIEVSNNTKIEISYDEDKGQPCFKYKIKDICGVTTELSDPFCVTTIDHIDIDSLYWSAYTAAEDLYIPLETPLYVLEYYDEESDMYRPVDNLTADGVYYINEFIGTFTHPAAKFRIVLNQNISGNYINDFALVVYSNAFEFFIPPMIYAPTVFTPDGIGPEETETFSFKPKFLKDGFYKIIDRYGNAVFTSESLEDKWDGLDKKSGKSVPTGLYFYFVNARDFSGNPFKTSGSISVLK